MKFDETTNRPIWPSRTVGPHFPSYPLTTPFLRLIPGVPRFGKHALEWLSDHVAVKYADGKAHDIRLSAKLCSAAAFASTDADIRSPAPFGSDVMNEASVTLRNHTELRTRFDFSLPPAVPVQEHLSTTHSKSKSKPETESAHIQFTVFNHDAVVCVGSLLLADIPLDADILTCSLFSPRAPFAPTAKLHLTYLHITPNVTAAKWARTITPRFAPRFTGHRGMGSSGPHAPHRPFENSVCSFLHAAHTTNTAVRTVELDVQLTKDNVAVVYHDWFFYPRNASGELIYDKTSVRTPIHSLTHAQFDSLLRTSPYYQQQLTHPDPALNSTNYDLLSPSSPSPPPALQKPDRFRKLAVTLQDVCESLPTSVDILVELKYPSPDLHEYYHLPYPKRDHFVNTILDQLFACRANMTHRNIAFLCFEPDICDMLRLKQTTFPVYLSHCATVDKPCDEFDPRTISPHVGFEFVKNYNLNGLMMFNKLVFMHPTLIEKIVEEDYPILTYGNRNSEPKVVQAQFDVGVSGVIADDVHDMIDNL